MQRFPSESQFTNMTGFETFDYEVGRLREHQENLGAFTTRYIERQRTLVEIVEPEEQTAVRMRRVVDERSNMTRRVATRRLDFDHIGAHISQQPPAKLRAIVRQIKHPQSAQRSRFAHARSSRFD